jgi:Holliday junction resolvase
MASRGRSAKSKGSNFERQVASIMSDELGAKVERVLLSGVRGEGDLQGLDVHCECKRQEQVRLLEWYDQAAKTSGGKPIAIIHKKSRQPIFVTMEIGDWMDLFREVLA